MPEIAMPHWTNAQAQQATAAGMLAITVAIAFLDVLMIRWFGRAASISHLMTICFSRYPSLAAAFIFWLGVWVGHTYLFHGPPE